MWAQKWPQGLYSGNGVIQNTSPDMNVLIGGTPSAPDVVIGTNPSGFKIALDIIGQQAIQITAPASNSRISSIVVYTDDLSLQSTDNSTTGSPSSCGLIVVNGTAGASPAPPTDSQIRTAITADGATGSQAVYGVIADIQIASSTTTITNTLIGMRRSLITTNTVADGAITSPKIDWTTSGGIWWQEIGRTTLTSSGDTITVSGLPVCKYLKVLATVNATGSVNGRLNFNGDTAGNYSDIESVQFGAGSGNVSQPGIYILSTSTTPPFYGEVDIMNVSSQNKLLFSTSTNDGGSGAGAVPSVPRSLYGKWANTSSSITSLTLLNTSTGDYSAGSEVVVLGHN